MKLTKLLASALSLAFTVSLLATPIRATNIPNFPLCTNPQGELIVSYDSGIHGIPGDTSIHSGSDKVYQVSDNTLIQCFCAIDGQGIQTNWWRRNSLTEDQINTLTKLGWIYIPNGSLWGLESTSYFASNSYYSCLPSTSNTTSSSGESSSSPSSSNNDSVSGVGGGGEVLGQILGAATGNLIHIYLLTFSGIIFFLIFLFWKKPKDASHN